MNVRYRVELSQAERDELTAMLGGGKHAARKLKRAQILLAADAGNGDEEIVCQRISQRRELGVSGVKSSLKRFGSWKSLNASFAPPSEKSTI